MQELCLGCMNPAAETDVCPHCGYVKGTPAKEPYHIPPGTMLRKYLVGRVLGYGGFGVTYLGYDTQFKIKVAIKEYLPGELATRMPGETQVTIYSGEKTLMFQSGREKFLDEARRLAKFTAEPGIVSIQDEFDENGTCYIVMEFLEGETLKQKLQREGKLPVEEAVEIISPILDALSAVHEKSIIHRDISPDNIFLTTDGRIKLLDFGAARYAGSNQSKSLSVILKPGYAPEEQYRSRGDQGPWSDVYACAATVYKMITGVTPEDAMERTLKDELKPPSKHGVKINKNVETAIMNALNIYKDNRTQSAQEFKEQLSGAVEVARLRNTHKLVDIGSWKAWHKALLAAILSLLTLVVVVAGVRMSRGQSPFPGVVFPGDRTQVPDVISMTEDEAKAAADAAELTPMIVNGDYSDSIEFGTIVNQSIPGGRAVQRHSYLEMVMSLGKQSIELMDVSGRDRDDVFRELSEAGFLVEIVEEYSNMAPGTIIRQEPEPGLYENGTAVLLAVSLGLEGIDTTKTVVLENYVGKPFSEVQRTLEASGIYIRKETVYSSEPEGVIIRQDAAAGKAVNQGYELKLTVSMGEQTVRIGNYYAWNIMDAEKELKALGIKVTVEYVENELYARDLIISQSPEAGTAVLPKTANVTLTVSKGREQINVPNVLGMSRAEAIRTLTDAGFLVNYTESYSTTVASGKIMEQTPAGGTAAYIGQTVEIIISCGKGNIDPTGLRLSQTTATMYYPSTRGSLTLYATITPENADDKRIIWESSNSGIVDFAGFTSGNTEQSASLTATGTGTATITARTNSGNITAMCRITVKPREIESVSIGNPATKQEYYKDEVLSTAGLTLNVTYNSGETEVVRSGFSGSPTKLESIGTQRVTVTYNGFQVSYDVNIIDTVFGSITVSRLPDKLSYLVEDKLNTKGLELTAHYKGKADETVTSGFTCTPTMLRNEGTQIITVTYNGKQTSFPVTVNQPKVSYLAIKEPPYTQTFYVGQNLNTNGLKLLVVYENGTEKTVSSGYTWSPSLLTAAGSQTVTISYGGANTTFKITVLPREIDHIKVRTLPQMTDYLINDRLNTGGLTMTAYYNDGTQETVTSGFTCSPTLLTQSGIQTITVNYESFEDTFTVNVSDKAYLTGLSVVSDPAKTNYILGETVDLSGLILEASYSNGSIKQLTSGWDTDVPAGKTGTVYVTVSYTENNITKEARVPITVTADFRPPENIYDGAALVGDTIGGRAGETVAYSLYLFNNPGFAATGIKLTYAEGLESKADGSDDLSAQYDAGPVLGGLLSYVNRNAKDRFIGVSTIGSQNSIDDGILVTVYFVIPENAASGTEYPIQLQVVQFTDSNSNDLAIQTVEGKIIVIS